MKRFLPVFFLFLISSALKAQPFGNEWIVYSQRYYKIPIAQKGVYRITFNDLANAGIPVSGIDPRNFQMFAANEEIPIYISGEGDGIFNSADFIEFIGRPNDGQLETSLYEESDHQPNPDYSLFNDTIYYFISWNSSINNLRFDVENDTDFESYTPTSFVWKKEKQVYTNSYYQGQLDAQGVSLPLYTEGEGWMGPRFGFSGANSNLIFDSNFNTSGAYTGPGAPPAEVSSVSAGVSNAASGFGNNHYLQIKYGSSNNLAVNHQFQGYRVNRFEFVIPQASIGATTTRVRHEVSNSLGVTTDYQAVATVSLTFPHITDLGSVNEFEFIYRLNTFQSKTRFDFTNISGDLPRIYTGGDNPQRILLTAENGSFKGLVENSFSDEEFDCFLVTNQSIKSVPAVEIAANNGFFTNFGLSDIDSAFVIVTHESLLSAAEQYRSYRQQRFNTVVVDVDELYDQFGAGVEKSGLAIRNFSDYLLNTWPTAPRYLLLIGKSIRDAPEGNSPGTRRNGVFYERNLVPTLGYPATDNMITAGLGPTLLEPAIRTGRLSATTQEDVLAYLAKLETFESQPHAEWMKNIIHFGGGSNAQEQNRFKTYLEGYEELIEDSAFGGITSTFLKTSSTPIEINASENVANLINGGCSMMTFFGHASSDGFDQTIDDPSNYEWNGKFPFLLGNGCYTGDFHGPGTGSTSETYTLLPNKGVIGFLSSVKLGFEASLNDYSRKFYRFLALDNYGGTVGDHMRKTVQEIQSQNDPGNPFVINTTLGMSLQGDPAVIVNSWAKPDLSVSAQDVFFTPAEVSAEVDSFEVNVVVTNIGKGTFQSFEVTLEHETPEQDGDSTYVKTVDGLLYKDTLTFRLPVDNQTGLGLHRFNVFVDMPEDQLDELDGFETVNNQVVNKELFITNGGIVPVYPSRFAVISEPGITLKASTGDPLAPSSIYRIEIDTTDLFNSPLLQSTEITQIGGVVEWTPNLAYPDSAVYFWRCAKVEEGELSWRESTFQYIPGKSGWGQAQIFQFKNNNFFQTRFNRNERNIGFDTGTAILTNNVYGNSTLNQIILNFTIVEEGACFAIPSIHLAVLEPLTYDAWQTNFGGQNEQNDFGNANANGGCRPRAERYFIFRQTIPEQMQALADLLNSDIIPDDHIIILYTVRYVSYDNWDNTPDIYDAFSNLGAGLIGSEMAQDSVPFSLILRKGDPNFVFEMYGDSINDVLNHQVELPSSGTTGLMKTQRIGPAEEWSSISWNTFSPEANPEETAFIRIIGERSNGSDQALLQGEFEAISQELSNLEDQISAEEYPYLRLEIFTDDPVNATPRQVDRWHVLFDRVPELAVNPDDHFAFKSEQLQQGENAFLSVAIDNISEIDADSLLVKYWIEDENRNEILIPYERQDSLRAGESLRDTIFFDTRDLQGSNTLWVEVNPVDDLSGERDQPEETFFNNLLRIPFTVNSDQENPILDVTFDGIHILNGEVVSSNPEILIALKDENPFLIMDEPNDTSLFKVFLSAPGGSLERVFFNTGGQETMQFIPAVDAKNRAKIFYRPMLEADGKYSLLVQASDKSGNSSGNTDFTIEFEVINRSTITEVLNYPNPFTTSTQFIFTLTGNQVPDEFKIQIMTVSGKVVREITQAEFGPIRIGRNRSVYRWDGHDEFGDRLANGVYLYRVIARLNGEDIELREGGASEYFNRGFGKMVLFR